VTTLDTVIQCLNDWPSPASVDGRVIVPTQCLFGSGSIIRVVVEGGATNFRVHDDGAAIDEFSSGGGVHPKASAALRSHFRDQGILVGKNGSISSPPVDASQLAPTIALIANASREAEELLQSRWKPRVRRNFKRLLRDLLEAEFPQNVAPEVRVSGSSQKQHVFDFALNRPAGGLVLVDAVHNDQNSISSTVLRNLDVKDANQTDVLQRIVFDDSEEWRAEDLNLLKLGGIVVPFSHAPEVLHRLAA
jgi:hypothetical protein